MRAARGLTGLAMVLVACVAGCSDDDADGSATTTVAKASPTVSSPSRLRDVDWTNASVPAAACGGEGMVQLEDGRALMSSARWPDDWNSVTPSTLPAQVEISGETAVYGHLDGDGREEAVVGIACTNGGGMAAGMLGSSLVVFTGTPSDMTVLAVLDTVEPADAHDFGAPYFAAVAVEAGTITATESRYGPMDGTCCPTGEARNTWRYEGTTMVLDETVVITEPTADGQPRPSWLGRLLRNHHRAAPA